MTTFSTVPGNETVKKQLTYALSRGTVGQALLFSGPQGSGKLRMAEALAAALLPAENPKNHPDFFLLQPQGKKGQHSIDLLRQLAEESQQPPYSGTHRVFIIDQAEKMAAPSANALLKSFEEPALTTVIILITSDPEALLPTVLSRCRQLRFQPLPKAKEEESNPLQQPLFELLYTLRNTPYPQLAIQIKQLTSQLEAKRKTQEAELLKELSTHKKEGASALQLEAFTKQQEGLASQRYQAEVERLIQMTLQWIRDLNALKVGVGKEQLFYESQAELMAKFLKMERPPSLEKALTAAEALRLGLDRSMSLQAILERFFLEIQ